ncbi:hypothetical protein BEWA_004060 [Theileria equi strain WA]|uniref:BRCT domain-containing protein n=1 Tax=Theileria equi strain WA TaxID=1537102 RepID=L0B0I0_THEEQ|nr:hypothetical protein BEWA_004060 [Theileria equi strain WA]AFZ80998.1 hypothetical protein BEWA_004060 [Theileria equi strain WA]|eukprot:XP_004830664.1 hypothetical protein BEWA_004060 [Theileria equi strain WA]
MRTLNLSERDADDLENIVMKINSFNLILKVPNDAVTVSNSQNGPTISIQTTQETKGDYIEDNISLPPLDNRTTSTRSRDDTPTSQFSSSEKALTPLDQINLKATTLSSIINRVPMQNKQPSIENFYVKQQSLSQLSAESPLTTYARGKRTKTSIQTKRTTKGICKSTKPADVKKGTKETVKRVVKENVSRVVKEKIRGNKKEKVPLILSFSGKRSNNIIERCTLASIYYEKGHQYFDFINRPSDEEIVTHLIVPHDTERPTLKILYALCQGSFVLTTDFLIKAEEDEKWPAESDYEHPNWLRKTERIKKGDFLYGYKFYLYERFKKMNHMDVINLIQLCGGKVVNELQKCTHCIIKENPDVKLLNKPSLPQNAVLVTENWLINVLERFDAELPPDIPQPQDSEYNTNVKIVRRNIENFDPVLKNGSIIESQNSIVNTQSSIFGRKYDSQNIRACSTTDTLRL